MTLLDRVTANLDGNESKALDGLRPLFMVIKLATSRTSFEKLSQAVPEAERWSKEAARGSAGRTGELLALITPETLTERFETVGFEPEEISRLGGSFGEFLAENVDTDVAQEIEARIPFVQLG